MNVVKVQCFPLGCRCEESGSGVKRKKSKVPSDAVNVTFVELIIFICSFIKRTCCAGHIVFTGLTNTVLAVSKLPVLWVHYLSLNTEYTYHELT